MYKGNNKIAICSQKALTKAFIDLLKNNSFKEISISQICKEANVSRQTFYSLYKNKENILIYEINNNYPFIINNKDITLEKICHIFSIYLDENYDFIKILIDNGFGYLIYDTFYHSIKSCDCKRNEELCIKYSYFSSFLAGGLMSITQKYIEDEKKEKEFIENITLDLFSGDIFR